MKKKTTIKVSYVSSIGGIKTSQKPGTWYNPANSIAKPFKDGTIQEGDELLIEYSKNDSGNYKILDYQKVGENESVEEDIVDTRNEEQIETQVETDSSSQKNSVPCVKIVTRAGAMNTAVKILENTGYKASSLESYMERVKDLRDELIREAYKDSREEKRDEIRKQRKQKEDEERGS